MEWGLGKTIAFVVVVIIILLIIFVFFVKFSPEAIRIGVGGIFG